MTEFNHPKLSAEENARIAEFQAKLPDAPVRIASLSKSFGLKVWKAELPLGISGAIRKEADGGYAIYANRRDSETRRRFTYAHELAHYLLHRDSIGDGFSENMLFRSNLSNDKEVEANALAADILMPMLHQLAETRKYGVRELARIFNVSRSALMIRLGIPE